MAEQAARVRSAEHPEDGALLKVEVAGICGDRVLLPWQA